MYRKAEWDKISEELREVGDKIRAERDHSTSDQLWRMFKDTVTDAVMKYIPTKMIKAKDNLPYMTAEISKLIKK